MIHFRTQCYAPELVIELSGEPSEAEIRRELSDLPTALARLPSQFATLVLYSDLRLLDPNAAGPLFYFVAHLFDAEPGICVFVDGGREHHAGLRTFIQQVGLNTQVAFVPTEEEGRARIRTYADRREMSQ